MADEISVVSNLTVNKGFLSLDRDAGAQQIDMAGTRYIGGVQDIGFAAHELLVVAAEFGTSGWGYFRNLDATNYVEVGKDVAAAFVPFAKLLPGEAFVVPLSSDVIYAKANTASVSLEFSILER